MSGSRSAFRFEVKVLDRGEVRALCRPDRVLHTKPFVHGPGFVNSRCCHVETGEVAPLSVVYNVIIAVTMSASFFPLCPFLQSLPSFSCTFPSAGLRARSHIREHWRIFVSPVHFHSLRVATRKKLASGGEAHSHPGFAWIQLR